MEAVRKRRRFEAAFKSEAVFAEGGMTQAGGPFGRMARHAGLDRF